MCSVAPWSSEGMAKSRANRLCIACHIPNSLSTLSAHQDRSLTAVSSVSIGPRALPPLLFVHFLLLVEPRWCACLSINLFVHQCSRKAPALWLWRQRLRLFRRARHLELRPSTNVGSNCCHPFVKSSVKQISYPVISKRASS